MKKLYAKYVNQEAGRESEMEEAKELFILNQYYLVEDVDMGQSYTSIKLKGFTPSFNSVFFDFYLFEDGEFKQHDIYKDEEYNPYMPRTYCRYMCKDGIERIFHKGDTVILTDGRTGTISGFCFCSECKNRGFYEIKIEFAVYDEDYWCDYITKGDYEDNFNSYYKIGDYTFGPKPSENDIKTLIDNCHKAINRAQKCRFVHEKTLKELYGSI